MTHVNIVSFSIMPNHFYMVLHQNTDTGIVDYIRKISNSYARYYNTKCKRSGVLSQGTFKAKHISSEEQLLHVSRYVQINPVVSGVIRTSELGTYKWTSYPSFLSGENHFVSTHHLLTIFTYPSKYGQFVDDQIEYATTLENIKRLIIE